jgi:hypothetical protein
MSKDKKLNITKVYTQTIKGSGKKVTIKEFSCCDKPGAISNKDPKKVRK